MLRTGLAAAVSLIALGASPALADTGFYQYPAMRGDLLVFASEGDLWRAGRDGGPALRLTNHEAEETDPSCRPTGRWWPSPPATTATATSMSCRLRAARRSG